uniref:Uncharacterized protein n=1 Tax=Rhizophora mucronata TaxID=61149 RepID=A0A2P2JF75_RHIMU
MRKRMTKSMAIWRRFSMSLSGKLVLHIATATSVSLFLSLKCSLLPKDLHFAQCCVINTVD